MKEAPGRWPGASSLHTSSGGRTRTPNDWTRTSCVANYTTPEGGAETLPGAVTRSHVGRLIGRDGLVDLLLDLVVDVDQAVEADDAADGHGRRLLYQRRRRTARPAGRHRRVETELLRDRLHPQGVVAVGHQHDPGEVAVAQDVARGGERLPRVAALHLEQQVLVGHALAAEVVGARLGLGAAVGRLLAAGDHDRVGHAVGPQVAGVVEPLLEHR